MSLYDFLQINEFHQSLTSPLAVMMMEERYPKNKALWDVPNNVNGSYGNGLFSQHLSIEGLLCSNRLGVCFVETNHINQIYNE